MRDAVELIRKLDPELEVDGEMHADTALSEDIRNKLVADSPLTGSANLLVMPSLDAANIAYKLLDHLGDAELTGPILEGMAKPVQILQQGDGVREVVHMAAICSVDAHRNELERL